MVVRSRSPRPEGAMRAIRHALIAVGLLATPLAAQQPRQAREKPVTLVRGVVVDAVHGDPLPNTMIRLVDARRGVLTDSLGRFAIADVGIGPELVAVKQYGYEEIDVQVDLRENH